MRVLSIGDVHCKTLIIDEVRKLVNDYDNIIFVGDYADDWWSGPLETVGTWKALKSFQDGYPDKVKLVIGNHDFSYLLSFYPNSSGYNSATQLLINHPENAGLKQWLRSLPVMLYVDGVTYTHAGVDVNWNNSTDERLLWSDDSPIWNRPGGTIYGPEPQVFGHTPSSTCYEVETNIWCIDTFSTSKSGMPIGDQTVLEVVDGTEFTKIKLGNKNDNNNISGIKA